MNKKLIIPTLAALLAFTNITKAETTKRVITDSIDVISTGSGDTIQDNDGSTPETTSQPQQIPAPTPPAIEEATPKAEESPAQMPSSDDNIRIESIEVLGTNDEHKRLSAAKENLTGFDEIRGEIYARVNNIIGGKSLGGDFYAHLGGQHGTLSSGVFPDAGERKMVYRLGPAGHLNINDRLLIDLGLGPTWTTGSKWILDTMPKSDIYALGGEVELGAYLRLDPTVAMRLDAITRVQHRKVGDTDYGREKDTIISGMLEMDTSDGVYIDLGGRVRFDNSDMLDDRPGALDHLAGQTSNDRTVEVLRRVQPNSYAVQPRMAIGTRIGSGAVGAYFEGLSFGPQQNVNVGVDLSLDDFVLSWRINNELMDGQRERLTYSQFTLKYMPGNNGLRIYRNNIEDSEFIVR